MAEVALRSNEARADGIRRKGASGKKHMQKTPRTMAALVSSLAAARDSYRATAMRAGCDE